MLKEAVLQDFCNFFSWIEPIWVNDKQSKKVLLKKSLSWRYSQKTWLRAVWYCTALSRTLRSAQYYTAPSLTPRSITLRQVGKKEMSENPKLSNTAWSPTQRTEPNYFYFYFQKHIFPWLLEFMWFNFEKIQKYFENPKWLTLHRVRPSAVWYCA